MTPPAGRTASASIADCVRAIEERRAAAGGRCLVVAVSGIDAAGKTTTARRIAEVLEPRGLRVTIVHLDDWHTAPSVRFSEVEPGAHFYRHAYRFDELFERLVEPLRIRRSLSLAITLLRLPRNEAFEHTYDLADIDVLLLEGLFLLRTDLRARYDLTIWIECSREVALFRAIDRNQEGLRAEDLMREYRTIYFPAQDVHAALDRPRDHAAIVLSSTEPM